MRILFTPLAGIAHYFHLVPLAWACRAAGHEVRIAARPPVDAVVRSGMPVLRAGGRYDFTAGLAEAHQGIQREIGRAPRPGDLAALPPETVRRLRHARLAPHVRAAEDMAEDLVPFARAWRPDVIVTVPIVLAAPLAAAASGARLVRHLWGPDISRHAGFPGLGAPPAEWPPDLVRLYERYGVEPQADHALRNIDPCPASLQIQVPDRIPVRYTPYNDNAELPGWLVEPPRRPRVCVTWSTVNTQLVGSDGYLVPEVLKALESLDVEIVATIPERDHALVGELPAGARLVSGLPHDLLLPSCDAVVHHGGAGTLLTAARHGVPQLVIAPVADQIFNAQRLAATGAGIGMIADETAADAIKAAATTVLTEPAVRAAATRLQAEILAQPAPTDLVRTLEDLI